MTFEQDKKRILEKIGKADKPDKSFKGSIDKQILPLINLINSKKNYYTTSSCAGRIIFVRTIKKKEPNAFLFMTHEKTSFDEIKNALKKIKNKEVWFKQEPCILHVCCKTIKDAQDLVNKAKLSGWKKSAIIVSSRRVVCELLSTEVISLPLVKNKLLVDDNYIKILVKEANFNLEKVGKKIEKFYLLVSSNK